MSLSFSSLFRLLGTALGLFFLFRLPMYTPSEDAYYYVEAAFFALLLIGAALTGVGFLAGRRHLHGVEILALLILLLPILGAYTARQHFHQPLLYGLITQRALVAVIFPVFVLYLLRVGRLRLGDLEWALLVLAWGTLAYWLYVRFFVDYRGYVASGGHLGTTMFRGARPFFERSISGFLTIYYTIAVIRDRRRSLSFFCLAICLFYMVVVTQSRTFVLCYAAAILLFLARDSVWVRGRWLKYAAGIIVVIVGLGVPVALLFPEPVEKAYVLFRSAAAVVVAGHADVDGSANVRLGEARRMMPFIEEHAVFGYGVVSKKWEVSGSDIVGGRFSVADIGILGGVFMYGVVGAAVLLLPFVYALRWTCRISELSGDGFMLSCKYFLFYYFLSTFLGNVGVQTPGPTLLFVVLVYYGVTIGRGDIGEDGVLPGSRDGWSGRA